MQLPDLGDVHDGCLALMRLGHERFDAGLSSQLLLRSGFDADGIAVVMAGSIAGAVSLCIDADAERLREGLRSGLCDFLVAHLDEALRILKNEVRRGLPVSVCLTAEPEACLAEMIDRGVQPDLISPASLPHAAIFAERGAIPVPAAADPDPAAPLIFWTVDSEPARSMPKLARLASEILDLARDDTPARRRWLESAPRYLGRNFRSMQCLRMTVAESSAFEKLAGAQVAAARVWSDRRRN